MLLLLEVAVEGNHDHAGEPAPEPGELVVDDVMVVPVVDAELQRSSHDDGLDQEPDRPQEEVPDDLREDLTRVAHRQLLTGLIGSDEGLDVHVLVDDAGRLSAVRVGVGEASP